ncbi:toll/interleukin-1 receptor domain-containing protein [Sphaerospermopsis aphanizomenoides BCCUSP55]|uniref:toll/interleukin-1 receptor domain-containing protein n=1 Tax=Sphaerospermopsis aphanizomenoides TaxID=459663 RepID=UPI0019039005|nr:toll/interleukin-1 receptor domain-containing protein [Sphaerospermopsis aphanizomenoides]MBK1989810.1 toll/interleukin-1 receptor domain-containing protein [Sphaerospermopsis aphanizomenoides BCCUSP55]
MLMPTLYDAFLSHASEDKEQFVDPLFHALQTRGCRIWYDRFEIDYGDFFETTIYEGINNSRFALFVITQNLIEKTETSWVWRELNAFLEIEKTLSTNVLIPILYDVTIRDVQEGAIDNPTLNAIIEKRKGFKTLVDGGIYGVADNLKNLFERR